MDDAPILLVLPPEAASLLGDLVPYAEADGGRWWSLTEEEYALLIHGLREAGIPLSDRAPSMIPDLSGGSGSVYVLVWDE